MDEVRTFADALAEEIRSLGWDPKVETVSAAYRF
jgi:hypothetical protein